MFLRAFREYSAYTNRDKQGMSPLQDLSLLPDQTPNIPNRFVIWFSTHPATLCHKLCKTEDLQPPLPRVQ